MYSYITYHKKTGEIIGTFESTAQNAIDNHPTMDTYFCVDCDREWGKEVIEKMDVIFDVSDGEEFDYVVDNPNKKPPYKCPKCESSLETQSNYGIRSVTAQEMQEIREQEVQFVKSDKGRIEVVKPITNISLLQRVEA